MQVIEKDIARDASLISRAAAWAQKAHESIDHRRKYTGQPYIVHPAEVAMLVSQTDASSEAMAAAWLHDTVEDVASVSLSMIEAEFGPRVAQLVDDLTEKTPAGHGAPANRTSRATAERLRLAKVSSEAKTIKLADIISNVQSIAEHDPRFARVYIREKALLMTALVEGHPLLLGQATRVIVQSANRLNVDLFDLVAFGGSGFQLGYAINDPADYKKAVIASMPCKIRVG